MGDRARQAITLVTLIAGFAGTVSFPGIHALLLITDWRGAVLVLSGVVALTAVPLFWYGCRHARAGDDRHAHGTATHRSAAAFRVMAQPTFWLLAVAFAMVALGHGLVLTHLLPLLDERGVGRDTAVLAASMIGPMQVAGRLAMMAAEKHTSMIVIGAACFVAMGIAALSLLGAAAAPMLLVMFVVFHGAGYGVTSIVRPVLIADLLGRINFGLVAGLLAVPFLAASAASPTIAALIWGIGGYDLMIWVVVSAILLGLVTLLTAAKLAPKPATVDIIEP
jgi:predicted MFS family arabinose efflux permease